MARTFPSLRPGGKRAKLPQGEAHLVRTGDMRALPPRSALAGGALSASPAATERRETNMMKLDESIAAIVTGGASGLGRASAEALAAAGVKVAVFDISEEAGQAFADEIGGVFCNVNIMDEESVEAGFAKARAALGQERILVHCAIVAGGGKTVRFDKKSGTLVRTPTSEFARSMEGIATATYRVASSAALGMAQSEPVNEDGERGSIILTSSAASQDGQIGQVQYGSGKGAVNSMVLPMARDLMDLGVRVNAILPGTFATPPMLRVK